ncbi:MAG: hypothetical protein DHS80DRAFT_24638 [Piptocephalis tieghemiana]|nr:MAG: hypothetical protein DHS80DRAFT_24638 [Piptocephalis tieghemiana]
MRISPLSLCLLLVCIQYSLSLDMGSASMREIYAEQDPKEIRNAIKDLKSRSEIKNHYFLLKNFGLPKPLDDFRRITETPITRDDKGILVNDLGYYASGYDSVLKLCRWSIVYINLGQLPLASEPREEQLFIDEEEGVRAWYKTKGQLKFKHRVKNGMDLPFNRGHMATPTDVAGIFQDRQYAALLKRGTYFMQNITPQPVRHNAGAWLVFEEVIRSFSEKADIWVVSGPVITKEDPKNGDAFIPSSYFKVIVARSPVDKSIYIGAIEVPADFEFKNDASRWEDLRRHVDCFPFIEGRSRPKYKELKLDINPFPNLKRELSMPYVNGVKDIWDHDFGWGERIEEKWDDVKERKGYAALPKLQEPKPSRPSRAQTAPIRSGSFGEVVSTRRPSHPSQASGPSGQRPAQEGNGQSQKRIESSGSSTHSGDLVTTPISYDADYPPLGGTSNQHSTLKGKTKSPEKTASRESSIYSDDHFDKSFDTINHMIDLMAKEYNPKPQTIYYDEDLLKPFGKSLGQKDGTPLPEKFLMDRPYHSVNQLNDDWGKYIRQNPRIAYPGKIFTLNGEQLKTSSPQNSRRKSQNSPSRPPSYSKTDKPPRHPSPTSNDVRGNVPGPSNKRTGAASGPNRLSSHSKAARPPIYPSPISNGVRGNVPSSSNKRTGAASKANRRTSSGSSGSSFDSLGPPTPSDLRQNSPPLLHTKDIQRGPPGIALPQVDAEEQKTAVQPTNQAPNSNGRRKNRFKPSRSSTAPVNFNQGF